MVSSVKVGSTTRRYRIDRDATSDALMREMRVTVSVAHSCTTTDLTDRRAAKTSMICSSVLLAVCPLIRLFTVTYQRHYKKNSVSYGVA